MPPCLTIILSRYATYSLRKISAQKNCASHKTPLLASHNCSPACPLEYSQQQQFKDTISSDTLCKLPRQWDNSKVEFRGASRGSFLGQRSEAGEASPKKWSKRGEDGAPPFHHSRRLQAGRPRPTTAERSSRTHVGWSRVPPNDDQSHSPLSMAATIRSAFTTERRAAPASDGWAAVAKHERTFELPTASGGAACALGGAVSVTGSLRNEAVLARWLPGLAAHGVTPRSIAGRRVRGFFGREPLCVRLGGELEFYCLRAFRAAAMAMTAMRRRPRRT